MGKKGKEDITVVKKKVRGEGKEGVRCRGK